MDRDTILRLPSMPAASPSYPLGPYRFVNREYFIISYESDRDAVRAALPCPKLSFADTGPNVGEATASQDWLKLPMTRFEKI